MSINKPQHPNDSKANTPQKIPKQAREFSAFFSLIIEETEKTLPTTFNSTGIRCFKKGCTGIISTSVNLDDNELYWKCSKCINHGTITGW